MRKELVRAFGQYERMLLELARDTQQIRSQLYRLREELERSFILLVIRRELAIPEDQTVRLRHLLPRMSEEGLLLERLYEDSLRRSFFAHRLLIDSRSLDFVDLSIGKQREVLAELFRRLQVNLDAAFDHSAISGGNPLSPLKETRHVPQEISVVIYLDTDSEADIARVVEKTDTLVEALGYEGPLESIVERGSFFRRSWARIKRAVSSPESREIVAKAGRAIEIHYLGSEQADIDQKIASAQAELIDSLADIPSACIRAGSILLIKHPGPNGPVLFARNLSQLEIAVLEKFPEIQRTPQTALEALALAISQVRDTESQQRQS